MLGTFANKAMKPLACLPSGFEDQVWVSNALSTQPQKQVSENTYPAQDMLTFYTLIVFAFSRLALYVTTACFAKSFI